MTIGGDNEPEREVLANLWTQQQVNVTEAKSEPEAVALARLKYENTRFIVVAVSALLVSLLVAGFLMNAYNASSDQAQGRIAIALITLLSSAFGAFVGRVSAK